MAGCDGCFLKLFCQSAVALQHSASRVTTGVGSVLQIITPLIGRPNVYNVLAAVAVGISLNVNLKVRGGHVPSPACPWNAAC